MMTNRGATDRSVRWARVLLFTAGVLALWALLLAITGGVRYDIGPVRLSSRTPLRPALLALLLAVIAWRLGGEDWLEPGLRRLAWLSRTLHPVIVSIAAASVLLMGVRWGARAAAGADSFGYVSQSALLRQANLRIDQSLARKMPWPEPEGALAPLGYRPAFRGDAMVPVYAGGVSLLMAAGASISPCGPYYVGPVCGAALVVLTYLLGRRFFNPEAGLVAAVLIAAAPAMLYMSMFPMADVPAATFWIGALLAAHRSSALRASAAGILTGMAIAIRPNLVPLAVFPWLLAIQGARGMRVTVKQTLAFAAGTAPFVIAVAWTNNYLYGSPFLSGYGNLLPLFTVSNAGSNLSRYPVWWLESQGPLAFLFVISLARRYTPHRPDAVILMAFAITVCLSYFFYIPFDAWWYLRFMLPAFPIAFLFCIDAVQWLTSRLSFTARFAALFLFAVASFAHAMTFDRRLGLPDAGDVEQKYVDAAVFVDQVTPPDSVIISMQYSGSIRYYSGRLTIRYDFVPPEWLDRTVQALEQSGRPVYILIEDWEEPALRTRFAGQAALGSLDSGPAAIGRGGLVRFYRVHDAPFEWTSPRIPRTSRFECRGMSPGFVTAGQ